MRFGNLIYSSGSIEVRVLPDNGPEAEEVFIIQLVAVTEGAVIDPSADIARLTVRKNSNYSGHYDTIQYNRFLNVAIHLVLWDSLEKPCSLRTLPRIQTHQ